MIKIKIKKIKRSSIRRSKRNKILIPIKLMGIIFIIMIMPIIALSSYNYNVDNNDIYIINYIYHHVENGDNLWSIAENYRPNNMNILDYIDSLKRINHIGEYDILQYGEWLTIPIYK